MDEMKLVELRLVKVAVFAGAAAVLTYLVRVLLPLPGVISGNLFLYMGPFVVVAFVGTYPFFRRHRPSAAALIATVFGVSAGLLRMVFSVVQLSNLHYIRGFAGAAESPEMREIWNNILSGVFTVQNGINYASDFFLDAAAFLFAVAMWNHPKFGKSLSLLSIALVAPHFVMKAITFPVPPAEAGLFDAGPLVSVWFAILVIQLARGLKWMRTEPYSLQ